MLMLHAVLTTHLIAAGTPPGTHAMVAVSGTAPPGATTFNRVVNWVKWVASPVAVVSLVAVGITLMIQHQSNTGVSHTGRVVKVFLGMLVVSSATAIAAQMVHP